MKITGLHQKPKFLTNKFQSNYFQLKYFWTLFYRNLDVLAEILGDKTLFHFHFIFAYFIFNVLYTFTL